MAAGPDSAYGGSQHESPLSGHKESAARPRVVPVPDQGQLAGVSSDRNLAVNQDTGEVLDDDTGEVVTTVTTTTTTTTTTRTTRGQGPGVSPAPPSSQATSSSDGSYFAGTPGNSSATSGSQTLHAQSRPSECTAPEQEQLPVVGQNVGQKVLAGYPAVPNVVVNDRPVSPRPGQHFSYPSWQVVDENTDDDGRAGSPPVSVPELEPPSCPAATRCTDANSTNGANAASRTPAASGGTRWEALEELKAAGKLAAPEAKSMLKGLEAFATGMHAVGKKLEPTFDGFDRRQAVRYAAQRRSRSANPSTSAARAEHPPRAQNQSALLPLSKKERQQGQQQHRSQAGQAWSSLRSKQARQRSRSEDRVWGVTDDNPPYRPQRRFRDASPDHPGLKPRATPSLPRIRKVRSITPPPDSHIQRVAHGGGTWAQPHAPPDPMYHGNLPLLGEGQSNLHVDGVGHGVHKTQLLRDSDDGSRRVPAEGKKGREREREKGGFFHRLKQKAT